MNRIRRLIQKAASMSDAWSIAVIVTSMISVIYALTHFEDTHPFSLFAYLYSTFGLIMFIYKMGQWIHRFSNWLRRHIRRYDQYLSDREASMALKTRKTRIIYITLRSLTILCAIAMFLQRDYQNVFLCALTLILFTLPDAIGKNLGVRLPSTLEIIIYCFIFAAEVLGEINNFYGLIYGWDTMLHTINGFLCAAIGFSLVDILNRQSKRIQLSPIYVAITAFCFSMTVGVVWEFIEFFGDTFFMVDMQKDTIIPTVKSILINPTGQNVPIVLANIEETIINMQGGETFVVEGGYLDIGLVDTMKDLLVNFFGAVIFSIFGYFYIKQRDDKAFVTRFIPVVVYPEDAENQKAESK